MSFAIAALPIQMALCVIVFYRAITGCRVTYYGYVFHAHEHRHALAGIMHVTPGIVCLHRLPARPSSCPS